jgi:hypothetical protein
LYKKRNAFWWGGQLTGVASLLVEHVIEIYLAESIKIRIYYKCTSLILRQ